LKKWLNVKKQRRRKLKKEEEDKLFLLKTPSKRGRFLLAFIY